MSRRVDDPFRIADALTVRTEAFLRARHAVATAVADRLIVLVVGTGGTGKTYAVDEAFELLVDSEERLLFWESQIDVTPKQFAVRLLEAATTVDYGDEERYTVFRRLERHLAATEATIWID